MKSGARPSAADGRLIVTASDDRTARVWDAATGRPLGEPLTGHKSWVRSAAFSPDGRRIITASNDGTARLWDAATGKPIRELKGHAGAVRSAKFSPDGRRIVTASFDKTARVWDDALPASRWRKARPRQFVAKCASKLQRQAHHHPVGRRRDATVGRVFRHPATGRACKGHCAALPEGGGACRLLPAAGASGMVHRNGEAADHTAEWKAWLRDTRAGKTPALPAQ